MIQIGVFLSSYNVKKGTIEVLEFILKSLEKYKDKIVFLFGGPFGGELEEFAKLCLRYGYKIIAIIPEPLDKEKTESILGKYKNIPVIYTRMSWGARMDILALSSDIALVIGGSPTLFSGSMVEFLLSYHSPRRPGSPLEKRIVIVYPIEETTSDYISKVLKYGSEV